MEILPAIDLRAGRVVRLLQGDYDRQIDYAADPVAVAAGFEGQGARWLHVVDLDGARTGQPSCQGEIARIVAATRMKVEVGGGVRSAQAVAGLLDLGVERVVIGTRALREWDWFAELVSQPRFAGRVMLGLDARQGRLAVAGWREATELSALDVAARADDLPLAGIIYTDIATDGMMGGPNLAAVGQLVAASKHPVVASGGIHCADDIRSLRPLNVAAAIIGRAIYEGKLSVAEALAAAGR